MEAFRRVAALEDHEGALVPVNAAQRDPTREDPGGRPVHVRPVAVEPASFTGTHETWPPHVEHLHLAAEQIALYVQDLRRIGHGQVLLAVAHTLGQCTDVGPGDACTIACDRVVDRRAAVDLADDRVFEQDLVARVEDHLRVQQLREEQVAVLIHPSAKADRIIEEIVRRRQLRVGLR